MHCEIDHQCEMQASELMLPTVVCLVLYADVDVGAAAGDDEEFEADERPTKVITEQVTFKLQAAVSFIDGFSGCSDGRSLRNILGTLAPRAVVLVGGNKHDTAAMSTACSKELPAQQTKVFTPGVLSFYLPGYVAIHILERWWERHPTNTVQQHTWALGRLQQGFPCSM